jgi:hypothetical protein
VTTCHTQPLSTTNASIVPMSLNPTWVPRSGIGGVPLFGLAPDSRAAPERDAQLGPRHAGDAPTFGAKCADRGGAHDRQGVQRGATRDPAIPEGTRRRSVHHWRKRRKVWMRRATRLARRCELRARSSASIHPRVQERPLCSAPIPPSRRSTRRHGTVPATTTAERRSKRPEEGVKPTTRGKPRGGEPAARGKSRAAEREGSAGRRNAHVWRGEGGELWCHGTVHGEETASDHGGDPICPAAFSCGGACEGRKTRRS